MTDKWAELHLKGADLFKSGDVEGAIKAERKAFETARRQFGQWNTRTAFSQGSLGQYYVAAGNYKAAERVLLFSLQPIFNMLGDDHPTTIATYEALAVVYRETGRIEEAEKIEGWAARQKDGLLQKAKAGLADVREYSARYHAALGYLDLAEENMKGVVADREKALGPDSPLVAASLLALADIYGGRKNAGLEGECLARARSICGKVPGAEDPVCRQVRQKLDGPDTETGRVKDGERPASSHGWTE